MKPLLSLTLVWLSCSWIPAQSQEAPPDGIRLIWKAFDPKFNDVYFVEIRTVTHQTMKVMGQEVKQTQEQTLVFRALPGGRDDKGNWRLEQEIVGVRLTIDLGGNKITTCPPGKEGGPLNDVFKNLIGAKVRYTIDPSLRVKKMEGIAQAVKNLKGAGPGVDKTLEGILSEHAFAQMGEPMWGAFPPVPVRKGTQWTRESELNLAGLGRYQTKATYKYEGGMDQHDRITQQTTLRFLPPEKNKDAALPFKITRANLASTEGHGEAVFDRERGRFQTARQKLKLAGQLTIEIGSMETTVEIDQEQETIMRTLDANPLPQAGK